MDEVLAILDRGIHASGDPWAVARSRVETAAMHAEAPRDLDAVLRAAVGVAGGKHSSYSPGADDGPEASPGAAPVTIAATMPQVHSADGVTTLSVPSFLGGSGSPEAQRYAWALADGIENAAPRTCGWIVDLRSNAGGNMWPMLSGIGALLPEGSVLAFRPRAGEDIRVTVQADGAGTEGSTVVDVGRHARHTDTPVAVVQDRMTASSGEAVLVALRGRAAVRTFGQVSSGVPSGNETHVLDDGTRITLTTALFVDAAGTVVPERPIEPDVTVRVADGGGAAAMGPARRWLAEQGCGEGSVSTLDP